jgi:hypothetical protein
VAAQATARSLMSWRATQREDKRRKNIPRGPERGRGRERERERERESKSNGEFCAVLEVGVQDGTEKREI